MLRQNGDSSRSLLLLINPHYPLIIMRLIDNILNDIKLFQPTKEGNWLALDNLLQELWAEEFPREALYPLFQLLERFPNDESAGVLWGVIHGIEAYPEYETELVDSLKRHPTDLTVTMAGRIANSGQQLIAGQPIESIYQLVINHPKADADAKETAQAFMKKLNK